MIDITTKKLEIKNYIEQTNETASNLKTTNDLTTILEKYEEDLKTYRGKLKLVIIKLKIYNMSWRMQMIKLMILKDKNI